MSDDIEDDAIEARLAELSKRPVKELAQDYLDLKLDLEREEQKRLDAEREQERWKRRCEGLIARVASLRLAIAAQPKERISDELRHLLIEHHIDAALRQSRSNQ